MIKYIILLLTFVSLTSMAEETVTNKLDFVTIEKIDTKSKIVTVEGVEYNYLMIEMDDSYFVSESRFRDLQYLPLDAKYYVNFHYDLLTKGKNAATVVKTPKVTGVAICCVPSIAARRGSPFFC